MNKVIKGMGAQGQECFIEIDEGKTIEEGFIMWIHIENKPYCLVVEKSDIKELIAELVRKL